MERGLSCHPVRKLQIAANPFEENDVLMRSQK